MQKLRLAGLAVLLLSSTAWAQQYAISTIAGGAPPPTPVVAVNASIGQPNGVASDSGGNIYFSSLNCVFKLDKNGILTRIAGNSRAGYSGDGGPATNAQLSRPFGLAIDNVGNLYIADSANNRIRKVSTTGIITTVVENVNAPSVAVDTAGNLYIAEEYRIRKVDPSGIVSTIAGGFPLLPGHGGSEADGIPATEAFLFGAETVTIDRNGNLYVPDDASRIRKISSDGIITTVAGAGAGGSGYSGDGGPATNAQLNSPSGVAIDDVGNLYFADTGNSRIRKVSPGGIITTIAGRGGYGDSGDGGQATNAQLNLPNGVAVDNAGNVYITDQGIARIRKVSPSGVIGTVAGARIPGPISGGFSRDGGPAISAQLSGPSSVAVDSAGNLYVSDSGNQRVRKISSTKMITTIAGNGTSHLDAPGAPLGDGGPAVNAQVESPDGLAVDRDGNVYIAQHQINRIRKVSPGGVITTVAGAGGSGYSGDGGLAVNANLNSPTSLAVDNLGNVYIADMGNNRIRKVSRDGIITTIAGDGTPGFSGDGGAASTAQLRYPYGVAVDAAGNLYIADSLNNRIRKVSPAGIITTVAGSGPIGPYGITADGAGNLYFADESRIRKVSSDGLITTIAGNGTSGYSGDGGPASTAQLSFASGVAVDQSGNVYVADMSNNAIRLLQPSGPALAVNAVVNSASYWPGPINQSIVPGTPVNGPVTIAPGEIVVIFGSGMGPAQLSQLQLNGAGMIGTDLGGTQVFFNGIPAPLIYTWATQVAAVVPYELSDGSVQVQVAYQDQISNPYNVTVGPSVPGIFTLDSTGKGQAAAINQDNSLNGPARPAPVGSIVSIYATGEGQTSPSGINGQLAGPTLPRPLLPVSVTIGGIPATVDYAGGAPTLVAGVMQVNVRIPPGVQPGNAVPVTLTVGKASSQTGIMIAVAAQ